MSHQDPSTVLYVKWTARSAIPALPHTAPSSTTELIYHYSCPICPTTPLALGAHCKLLALSDPRFHTADPLLGLTPLSARAVYDTYDPHIEGPIVAVRTAPAPSSNSGNSTGTGALVLVLRNTCAWNPVAYAHITIPYVPGLTVHPALAAHARAPTPAPAPFPATAPRRNSCAYPPLLPPLTHLHTPYSEGDKDTYKRIEDERRSAPHTHARTSVPPVLEEGVTILAHGPPVPARAPRSPYFDFDEPRAEDDVVAALKRAAGLGLGAGAGAGARRQRSASASGRC